MEYDAIVAGVGGMGSATIAELAARGARVLGLDRGSIPNDRGSSHGVNRIIRLVYQEDPRYVPLLRLAYERWAMLGERMDAEVLITTGAIDAGPVDGVAVGGALRCADIHGLAHEVLDADELRARYPGFRVPSDYQAVFHAEGGFVLSERAIAGYATLALADGAELRGHEPLTGWEATGDGVLVRTPRGEYRARRLIISAGAWIGSLVRDLAALAIPERQVLMWSRTLRPERFAVGAFPVFNLEVPEGRYYGFPEYGIPGFKIGVFHHRNETIDPDDWDRDVEPADEERLRAATSAYFPDANGPALTLKTCMFTNTPDEHFIIDTLPEAPQVVVLSPCSGHGFKFASALGVVAADLALDGGTDVDLDMFRIDRFSDAAPEDETGPG